MNLIAVLSMAMLLIAGLIVSGPQESSGQFIVSNGHHGRVNRFRGPQFSAGFVVDPYYDPYYNGGYYGGQRYRRPIRRNRFRARLF